jgi:hypothetical protein
MLVHHGIPDGNSAHARDVIAANTLLAGGDQMLAGRSGQLGFSGFAIAPVSPFGVVQMAARTLGVGDIKALRAMVAPADPSSHQFR